MLGSELEKQFNIPQQYRSRYDKMFSDFISISDKKPREYNQSDINAYTIILDSFKKGLRRLDVIKLLEQAVDKGFCERHSGEPLPVEETHEPQEKKVRETRIITKRREDNEEKKSIILQLAEEIGALREQVKMLNEAVSDLEISNGKVVKPKIEILAVERFGTYKKSEVDINERIGIAILSHKNKKFLSKKASKK